MWFDPFFLVDVMNHGVIREENSSFVFMVRMMDIADDISNFEVFLWLFNLFVDGIDGLLCKLLFISFTLFSTYAAFYLL